MKVVIDTNVLVSGIFWSGIPGKIVNAWLEEKLTLIATTSIVNEYIGVIEDLSKKFSKVDVKPLISMIMAKTHIYQDVLLNQALCRDPEDDKFIACALANRIHYIISGDKDLLECSQIPTWLKISKPNDFYHQYLTEI